MEDAITARCPKCNTEIYIADRLLDSDVDLRGEPVSCDNCHAYWQVVVEYKLEPIEEE